MPQCNCPTTDTSSWENKVHDWSGRTFFTRRTPLFLHTPLKMRSDIERAAAEARELGLRLKEPMIVMSRDGLFLGQVMLETETPEEEIDAVTTFPGVELVSRVFQGPWRDIAGPTRRLVSDLKGQGRNVNHIYYGYMTCPACVDTRGFITVIYAQID